jgi:hypothetical protein
MTKPSPSHATPVARQLLALAMSAAITGGLGTTTACVGEIGDPDGASTRWRDSSPRGSISTSGLVRGRAGHPSLGRQAAANCKATVFSA